MVALERYPHKLAPIKYGWEKDEASKTLLPVIVPVIAPLNAPKGSRYGCVTGQLFANARCKCGTAQMPCAVFCGSHVMEDYGKRLTQNVALLKKTWTKTMILVMAEMF